MARLPKEIVIRPPYDEVLKGILSFRSFQDAERTLLRLEELRQKYLAECDDKGIEYCRQTALLGRRRAELISCNKRVQALKRRQKREIAFWFQIWLETPDLFKDWLELRKGTLSFLQLSEAEGRPGQGEEVKRNGQEG